MSNKLDCISEVKTLSRKVKTSLCFSMIGFLRCFFILNALGNLFFFFNSRTVSKDFPNQRKKIIGKDSATWINYLWVIIELQWDLLSLDFVVQDLDQLYN